MSLLSVTTVLFISHHWLVCQAQRSCPTDAKFGKRTDHKKGSDIIVTYSGGTVIPDRPCPKTLTTLKIQNLKNNMITGRFQSTFLQDHEHIQYNFFKNLYFDHSDNLTIDKGIFRNGYVANIHFRYIKNLTIAANAFHEFAVCRKSQCPKANITFQSCEIIKFEGDIFRNARIHKLEFTFGKIAKLPTNIFGGTNDVDEIVIERVHIQNFEVFIFGRGGYAKYNLRMHKVKISHADFKSFPVGNPKDHRSSVSKYSDIEFGCSCETDNKYDVVTWLKEELQKHNLIAEYSAYKCFEPEIFKQNKTLVKDLQENDGKRRKMCLTCPRGTRTYLGPKCTHKCQCHLNAICDSSTGECPRRKCNIRHSGRYCNQTCPPFKFNPPKCDKECGCLNSEQCKVGTGECFDRKCQPRWRGDFCNNTCANGGYGKDCKGECHCEKPYECSVINGRCRTGKCLPRYTGSVCQNTCKNNYYGYYDRSQCIRRCLCNNPEACRVTDGKCVTGGCKKHSNCTHCSNHYFLHGFKCSPCHCKKNKGCIQGVCKLLGGGCAKFWSGPHCQIQNCGFGFYALEESCAECHCLDVNKCQKNGKCSGGKCALGYYGEKCNISVGVISTTTEEPVNETATPYNPDNNNNDGTPPLTPRQTTVLSSGIIVAILLVTLATVLLVRKLKPRLQDPLWLHMDECKEARRKHHEETRLTLSLSDIVENEREFDDGRRNVLADEILRKKVPRHSIWKERKVAVQNDKNKEENNQRFKTMVKQVRRIRVHGQKVRGARSHEKGELSGGDDEYGSIAFPHNMKKLKKQIDFPELALQIAADKKAPHEKVVNPALDKGLTNTAINKDDGEHAHRIQRKHRKHSHSKINAADNKVNAQSSQNSQKAKKHHLKKNSEI